MNCFICRLKEIAVSAAWADGDMQEYLKKLDAQQRHWSVCNDVGFSKELITQLWPGAKVSNE